MTVTPSQMDDEFMMMARSHRLKFLAKFGQISDVSLRFLEVGSSVAMGDTWDTLDIVPGGTFCADITRRVHPIAPSTYDIVLCMEVLEHVVDPFAAVAEIRRLTKNGGLLLASAPFNAREHGPLPDPWRFSRHAWRVLLCNWDEVELDVLMTPGRPLMPLHICVSARCNKDKNVDPRTLTFERMDT